MKISNGFISNSSSSSFVIYGQCFSNDVVETFAKTFLSPEEYKKSLDYGDLGEKVADRLGVSYNMAYEEDEPYYFGEHPATIGDEETGKQFRTRITEALKVLDPNVECECHEVETYH